MRRRRRQLGIKLLTVAWASCLLLGGHAWADGIPVHFINGQPVVTARIQGQAVQLKLDLGANLSIALDMDTLRNLPAVGWRADSVTTINVNGKASVQRTFALARVRLGKHEFRNVKGVVYAPWGVKLATGKARKAKTSPVVGVIGWEFFKRGTLCLSYRQHRLSLDGAAANCVGKKSRELPLSISADGIVMHYALGSKTYRAVLDSGATLSLWNTAISTPPESLTQQRCGTFTDGKACKRVSVPETVDSEGLLGGVRFVLFKTRSLLSDLLLGADFFQRHDVFLDLARSELYVGSADAIGSRP